MNNYLKLAIVMLVASCGGGGGSFKPPRDLDNACAITSERPAFLQAMRAAQVYPGVWDPADGTLEGWLLGELDGLRGFYRAAATAEQSVIQTIC